MIWSFQNEECLDFSEDFRHAFRMAGVGEVSLQTNMIGGPIPSNYRDLMIVEYRNTDPRMVSVLSQNLTNFGIEHKIFKDNKADSKEAVRLLVSRPK